MTIGTAIERGMIVNRLEIGCGNHRLFSDSLAIDIDKNSDADIISAAEHISLLGFIPDQFDRAYMIEVIEHLHNPYSVLKDLTRYARELYLTTPNVYFYRLMLRWTLLEKVSTSPDHIWHWAFCDLEHLLDHTGWRIRAYGFLPFQPWHGKQSVFHGWLKRVTCQRVWILAERKS